MCELDEWEAVGVSREYSGDEINFLKCQSQCRHFLKSTASATAALARNAYLPGWAKGALVIQSGSADIGPLLGIRLDVRPNPSRTRAVIGLKGALVLARSVGRAGPIRVLIPAGLSLKAMYYMGEISRDLIIYEFFECVMANRRRAHL
jgi:hypothetical protein